MLSVNASQVHALTVQVSGQDLHVEVSGSGRPLLLCNGIGYSTSTWEAFVSALEERGEERTIVRFDAPGVGRSPLSARDLSMADLADLVLEMMSELGHPSFDLLGVSLGGALAQEVARRAPERVSRLVLVSTLCGLGAIPAAPHVLLEMLRLPRQRSEDRPGKVRPWLYGGHTRTDASAALRLSEQQRTAPVSRPGYRAQMRLWKGWTSLPWLSRLPMPVLVLSGSDDPIVPVGNAYLLKALCPRAQLRVVKGGGHLLLWDDAARSAEIVSEFLA